MQSIAEKSLRVQKLKEQIDMARAQQEEGGYNEIHVQKVLSYLEGLPIKVLSAEFIVTEQFRILGGNETLSEVSIDLLRAIGVHIEIVCSDQFNAIKIVIE